MLHFLQSNDLNSLANNETQLEYLADACTYTYGNAPSIANGLLDIIGASNELNYHDCSAPRAIEPNDNKDKPYNVYPNPTSNQITIDWKTMSEELFEISVFDITGQKLISSNHKELDFSSLNNGIYFIHISTNKDTYTEKIIKID